MKRKKMTITVREPINKASNDWSISNTPAVIPEPLIDYLESSNITADQATMEDENKELVSCVICEEDFLNFLHFIDHFKREHMNNCSGEESTMLVAEETYVNLYDFEQKKTELGEIKIEKEEYHNLNQANAISIPPGKDGKLLKTENSVLTRRMSSKIIKEQKDIKPLQNSLNHIYINQSSGCNASVVVKIENEHCSNEIAVEDTEAIDEIYLQNSQNIMKEDKKGIVLNPSKLRSFINNNEEKPFACEFCKRIFRYKKHLTVHMLTHKGVKRFSCHMCNYNCRDQMRLMNHIRTHTTEKPYTCHLCDYKCAHKYSLVAHLRRHNEKPYNCSVCGYESIFKGNMALHFRTHSGYKPFSCNMCNYKCSRKNVLVDHLRTHTGEKPYACHLCGYKSVQRSHLVRHLRIHTGVRLYSCDVCGHKSNYKSNMVTHINTHNRGK